MMRTNADTCNLLCSIFHFLSLMRGSKNNYEGGSYAQHTINFGRQLSDSRTQRHSLVTAQVILSADPGSSTTAPGSSIVARGAQLLNGAAVGDLGASWESSSILGSRTNGQQWARSTNASNSSFLNRPFVPPAARSGATTLR